MKLGNGMFAMAAASRFAGGPEKSAPSGASTEVGGVTTDSRPLTFDERLVALAKLRIAVSASQLGLVPLS